VSPSIPNSPEFSRLAAGDNGADLTLVALEIARDTNPDLDTTRYLDRIDALADRVRPRVSGGASTEELLRQINWVLFVEEQFTGNEEDYHDPRNSDLSEVLDRRTGIPISLSVLYRAVAGRLGLILRGVNLPVHFVLRTEREDGVAIFIDPFHAGALLDQDGCRRLIASRASSVVELTQEQFLPCSITEVVARILRNLRAIHLQAGDVMSAAPVLRRLVALCPEVALYRKDLGLVLMGLDRPSEAIEQLSAYLEQAEQPKDSPEIRGLILDARRRNQQDE
jgi:regulator of sirC expression with transglutaminase-like and TPR domain